MENHCLCRIRLAPAVRDLAGTTQEAVIISTFEATGGARRSVRSGTGRSPRPAYPTDQICAERADARLTDREVEVLRTWLRHDSKQAAATELFISESTVSTHIARIRTKYSAVGRTAATKSELFIRAIQDGYVSLDEW